MPKIPARQGLGLGLGRRERGKGGKPTGPVLHPRHEVSEFPAVRPREEDFSGMGPFPAHIPAPGRERDKGDTVPSLPPRQERGDGPKSSVTPPGVPWGQRGPLLMDQTPPVGFVLLFGIELPPGSGRDGLGEMKELCPLQPQW